MKKIDSITVIPMKNKTIQYIIPAMKEYLPIVIS